MHDTNSATIRYSLIKRLRSVQLAPAPPAWLLPTLDELVTMSWVRCRCLYFPLGGEGGGDDDRGGAVSPAELARAAGAVFAMRREALERDYYGNTKRNLGSAP